AVLLTMTVIAANRNTLFAGLTPHLPEAHRALSCADGFRSLGDASSISPRLTVVAHFASVAERNTASAKLRAKLPESTMLTPFGNSLFIQTSDANPSTRDMLLQEAKRLAKGSFACTSNAP